MRVKHREWEIACSQLCGLATTACGFSTVQTQADYDAWLANETALLN
jgi:heme/copper-type cytochrome/quinol oxidase subunit 2